MNFVFCQNPNLTATQPNLNLVGFDTIIAVHTTPPTHLDQHLFIKKSFLSKNFYDQNLFLTHKIFRPLGPLFLVEVEFLCGWWWFEQQ